MRAAPHPENLKLRHRGNLLTYKGRTMPAGQWADLEGIKRTTLYMRLKRGIPWPRALTMPVTPNGRVLVTTPVLRSEDSVPRLTEGYHPIVTAIYRAMKRDRWTYRRLSEVSGVSISAIQQLKRNGPGYFVNVEAICTTLGLRIVATKRRRLANEVRADRPNQSRGPTAEED